MTFSSLKIPRLNSVLAKVLDLYRYRYTNHFTRRLGYRYAYYLLKFLCSNLGYFRPTSIEKEIQYFDYNILFRYDVPEKHLRLWRKIIQSFYYSELPLPKEFPTDTFILSRFDYYYFRLVFNSYTFSSPKIEIKEQLRDNRFLFIYEDLLNHILKSRKRRFNIIVQGLPTKISYYFFDKIICIYQKEQLDIDTLNSTVDLRHTNIYLSGIKDYSQVSVLSYTLPLHTGTRIYLLNRPKTKFYVNPNLVPRVPYPDIKVIYTPKAVHNRKYSSEYFNVLVTPNPERLDPQTIYLLKSIFCHFVHYTKMRFIVISKKLEELSLPNVEFRYRFYSHSIMELENPIHVLLDVYRHNHFERVKDCHYNGIFPLIFVRKRDITTDLAERYLQESGYKNFLYFRLPKLISRLKDLYFEWLIALQACRLRD